MSEKVVLILVDGMRPDSLEKAGHPFIEEMKAKGSSTLEAQTVMPSVTLPCSSAHAGNEASKAIDNSRSTFWHTEWTPMVNLPQSLTLHLGGTFTINQISYTPRQDGTPNGNITGYNVYTSTNGTTFTKVKTGIWNNDSADKSGI